MASLNIRNIQPHDNELLAKIIRSIFIEHDAPQEGTVFTDPTTDDLFSLFQSIEATLLVGELDGRVIGCGGIYPTPGLPEGCAEFVKFYIAPEGRGLGLGVKIMDMATDWARQQGYTHLYIESLPHYAKAIRMYEKQGFTMLDTPLGESGHTTCNIWMIKEL